MPTKPFSIEWDGLRGAHHILRNGETFITTHATDTSKQIAEHVRDALNAYAARDAKLADAYARTAMLSPEVMALCNAAVQALPLLCRLGDFIANGPVNPHNPKSLGERCDVIGALRDALSALGVAEGAMAPTRNGDAGAVQLALYVTDDGQTWRLMRDAREECYVEAISRRSAERGLSWAFVVETTLHVGASWQEAYTHLESIAKAYAPRADRRSEVTS